MVPNPRAYWADRRGVRTAGLPTRPVRRPGHRAGRRDVGVRPSHAPPRPGRAGDLGQPRRIRGARRGPRLQPAVDHRHRAQPPAAALGPAGRPRPLRAGVQRRDLQLPGIARGARAPSHGAEFATDGDGEAIIAAYHHWGVEALHRLRGMFAFALWDTVEQRAVLRARPVRHQAAVHGHRRRAAPIVGSEKKCLLDLARDRRHRPRHRRARRAALHGAAVRARARDAAPRRAPAGVGQLRPHPARAARPEVTRYFAPRFAAVPFVAGRRAAPLRRDHRGARGFGRQAHARRRHHDLALHRDRAGLGQKRKWKPGL